MDRAAGGEILVTDTVRQLVGTMPDGAAERAPIDEPVDFVWLVDAVVL
jgi:hypothetical protein